MDSADFTEAAMDGLLVFYCGGSGVSLHKYNIRKNNIN
jgi:hypothetical protein